ncbi:hypothetical protein Cob_v007047 [Colletotrichum orbiculare MAFF 240422]|uniref:Uncharacterized protein n=1 Tax=Colletotrichum orbiculare (strain 104-T / ATCC 96160 / CBS 514.97 / LARS 414 / MAFF 240422) TaxID=1213857 RepID=A0A484FPC2_COLOR|nr:hypothetical protein Cob_v007047 [Colletotrichum orbiculare MAFF 240422]
MRIALLVAGFSFVVSGHLIGDGSSQLHKRRLSSIQLPRGGDSWACGAEELNKLESTIDEARKLARNAAGVLAVGGSENSAAYTKWFGKGNANTKTRISLKMNNYDSLVNDLRFPDNTVAFDGQTLDPQGLTYVCWPQDEDHCELGFIAGVIRPGFHPGLRTSFRGHVLAMCPKFFNLASQDEVAAALKKESPTLRLCSSIPDENKIQNAQNFALFALDVAAFPERGKRNEKGKSCLIGGLNKRAPAEGSEERLLSRGDGPTDFSTSIFLCLSALFSTPFLLRGPPSQSTIIVCCEVILHSQADPSSVPNSESGSFSHSRSPPSGVGGGFVLAPSGALLPIAAGSTAVVSASTAANGAEEFKLEEEKKDDPEIPSVTPTISAPASTASDDLCSLATQSDAPEPATPDAPDFAFKDFVFLPGPEPTVFASMTKPPTTTTTTTTTTTKAAAKTSAPAVPPPLPCYNFDNASYGWCCRGPDSPCEKDLGTCYFDGTGGSNVLPNSAACPPPEGARH